MLLNSHLGYVQISSMNQLELFLVGQLPANEIPADLMRDSRLAGLLYSNLSKDHPAKPVLRASFLSTTARHALIKSHIIQLVKAWNAVGIVPMLFKGFMLAEFVYDTPANRYYGDVDVILPEQEAARAASIAAQLPGWSEVWNRRAALASTSHEESQLLTLDRSTSVDLHRFAIHNAGSWTRLASRVSDSVWNTKREIEWEECRIYIPSPEDCVLFGVVLSRMWDNHPGIKPHDVVDLRCIVKKWNLTRETLYARAQEIGCEGALSVFLLRCDPWHKILNLSPLNTRETSLWRQSFPQSWRFTWHFNWFDYRIQRLIPLLLVSLEQFSNVIRAKALLRHHKDLFDIARENEPLPKTQSDKSLKRILRVAYGVRMVLLLVGPRKDACVPRSLAVYHALRAEGHNVEFVSGVRRINGKLEGHAWVEVNGLPLEVFNDIASPQMFKENFRYPAKPFTEVRHISSDN